MWRPVQVAKVKKAGTGWLWEGFVEAIYPLTLMEVSGVVKGKTSGARQP